LRLQKLLYYVGRSLFKADRLMYAMHLVHVMLPGTRLPRCPACAAPASLPPPPPPPLLPPGLIAREGVRRRSEGWSRSYCPRGGASVFVCPRVTPRPRARVRARPSLCRPDIFADNEWRFFVGDIVPDLGMTSARDFPSWAAPDRTALYNLLVQVRD
jgi:hypothetical protein